MDDPEWTEDETDLHDPAPEEASNDSANNEPSAPSSDSSDRTAASPPGGGTDDGDGGEEERGFFAWMGRYPLPFLVLMPAVLIALTVVGWSREDKVETDVANLWIPTGTEYYRDKMYAAQFAGGGGEDNAEGRGGISVFAAMAVSRDGENLFQEGRLEEIRERMEVLENTTVEYKGETYQWSDLCASNQLGMGTTYKFPCARLSTMDYFQESRWAFSDEAFKLTWYDTVYDQLVKVRVPRYGILRDFCPDECSHELRLRSDADYAVDNGYDASYANPLGIFVDIGSLEQGNRCKMCIETMYEEYMSNMTRDTTAVFGKLRAKLWDLAGSGGDAESGGIFSGKNRAAKMLDDVSRVIPQINRSSVEDFYRYYVTRSLYADLGKEAYQITYNQLRGDYSLILDLICDTCVLPMNVTPDESRAALLRHADNGFSGVNAGGAPLPLWNPSSGFLLDPEGIEPDELGPFGGSGVDLSGGPTKGVPLQSAEYFGLSGDAATEGGEDPFDDEVRYDPVVVWFLSGVLPHTSRCSNDDLTADKGNFAGFLMADFSPRLCTKHNEPFKEDGNRTKQHFARMWYDLLTDSPNFLNITQGTTDPYVWTTGQGCGYSLAGQRPPYTNQTEGVILKNASMELYYVDEGEVLGALDRHILIGGTEPKIGDYNQSRPLVNIGLIQNIYLALIPEDIVDRVKNCNRPGGPINDLSVGDAKAVLFRFKESFENAWSQGWDDPDAGEVQMVGFFDDTGSGGSTARMLEQVTLSSGSLMTISFVIIVVFSVVFLASFDVIRSRVLITLIGVALVILSFFAAVGLAILVGIKINITIGWTLPFIVVGLGVDDMYIISLALKNRGGYELRDFNQTMKEVVVPVTLTSLVNFCMFAVMNLSDIPAAYKTAQAAMLCVAFLWLTIILCFPAYCYLDMKRQAAGRADVLFCFKSNRSKGDSSVTPHSTTGIIYEKVYKPLIVTDGCIRSITHIFVWIAAVALLSAGIYGSLNRQVGLGLEDFFSTSSQVGVWATYRTQYLGSWNIRMNWGAEDYGDPSTQLKMIQQFEGVVSSDHVSEIDTDQLWMAKFAVWASRQCNANFVKRDPAQRECGRDFDCQGMWQKNTLGLRLKNTNRKTCLPRQGGVCRHTADMHPDDLAELAIVGIYDPVVDADASWCPVFDANTEKLRICVEKWREYDLGDGSFVLEPNTATESVACPGEFFKDDTLISPIPISSGPLMFGINMLTHDDTLDLIRQTRAWCDDDDEIRCWMSGIPFDYWEQYIYVDGLLYGLFGISVAVGFLVSAVFLLAKIFPEHEHSFCNVLSGSVGGAFFIIATCILSTVSVIGLSSLAGVATTAFSAMAFVLSVGFVVEYSVHITHRFITAPMEHKSARERVEYSMSFLFLPTFMSFVSSTIGVVCLAFSEFHFNKVFFFRPLIIVMFVTYFFGCFFLPVVLSLVNFNFLKLGHHSTGEGKESQNRLGLFDGKVQSQQIAGAQADRSISSCFKDECVPA